MSETWKDNELALKAMEEALAKLRDHFENVQIFCSRLDPDGSCDTQRLILGKGNMYARVGQVRDWLTMAEEQTREEAREKYREESES